MYNQSCHCQNTDNQTCGCRCHQNQGCQMNTAEFDNASMQGYGMNDCGMNNMCGCTINGCPRPQPLVAPRRVCVTNQITPVPQPVICPIECRRVNRCMYFPVFYPRYEQTFMTVPFNQSY